ncbi:hypothetical protein [Methyloversatilis discipulorum]|uniref:hypothetical protein n=1 Tax=Methyloversatilis discipulorum TaxID=1119528 RepID=UPI0031384590
MNAPAVDPRLMYALGLQFHNAAAAVDHYFGEGIAESNPFLVVTVARLINERERGRESLEAADQLRQSLASVVRLLDTIAGEAQERRNEARDGLVMLCDTVRELGVDEAIAGVRRAIDALTVEVSAVTVAINSASL